ncbi:MAG: GDP-mannose 4,6-dehydratase [Nanoarchaeota archaeon]|nr:GDP-mannose 4,6-dehydratase [Nanoarchaeota archaeon]
MSNILVTGGAGFVGSYIVEKLVKEGHDVRVIDDLRTGDLKNLESVIDKITFCQDSILNNQALEPLMYNIDIVYHLAAEVGVNRVIGRDKSVWENDYKGTLKVINKALKCGAEKFLFTSTSEVYGKFDQKRLPMKENDKFKPDTVYGEAKLFSENVVSKYAKRFEMTGVSTRYFNAYGPRQTLNGYCVPHFIDAALKGENIKIHGNGSQTRDLTYIDDAVKLTMTLLDDYLKDKVKGESFNIGTGFAISMNDLAQKIIEMTESKSKIIYIPNRRPTDGYHKKGDATKILEVTGLKPRIGLEEGLAKTIEYHKQLLMSGA